MKTIITQITANNQILIRYVDRPNCLPARNLGDMSCDVENEQIGKLQQEVERTYRVIRNASIEYLHDNSRRHDVKQDIIDFYSRNGKVGEIYDLARYKGKACTIPDKVEYKRITNNAIEYVCSTPHDLHIERKARLDIIKKSQQRKKRERSWGKLQADKKFTLNGKQKILEAGAVISKEVGDRNSFVVTLTVPGSGWDVYDVISRQSGYMVNRITQIIRRAEEQGIEAHWFYVWEHQKRGALHMHWCIAVKDDWRAANLLSLQIRAKWTELLEELTVKSGIDLFKKRGFSGTWRHSPEVWQNDIQRVKKSVAGYFSKYCTKSYDGLRATTRRRNHEKRKSKEDTNSTDSTRVYSLCPSRYWGCAMRTKSLAALYRVTVRLNVASSREGHFIYQTIRRWTDNLSDGLTEVSRSFTKAAPDTGFIYAKGWERRLWFSPNVMEEALTVFKRFKQDTLRRSDAIGGVVCLFYDW